MQMIDVLTSVYLFSLLTMAIVTTVRPFYVNHWNMDNQNTKEMEQMYISVGEEEELDAVFVAGMVTNQIVIMILGK